MNMTRRGGRFLLPVLGAAALMIPIGLLQAQEGPTLERGQAIYAGHCAACHGIDGNGNGPEAGGMTPPPTNFQDTAVMAALTNNAMEQAMLGGKSGSAMEGYGTILNAEDVDSIILYLRSLPGP